MISVTTHAHTLGCEARDNFDHACNCGFGLGGTPRADVISPTLAKLVARACGDTPRDNGDDNPNSSPK